ncbi:hypothetical protein BC829DRAFT_446929 [Chytridium lagenaria]|nr:hypothetical protein BC829DRAFT_446929 [Chytridium lagenaria]
MSSSQGLPKMMKLLQPSPSTSSSSLSTTTPSTSKRTSPVSSTSTTSSSSSSSTSNDPAFRAPLDFFRSKRGVEVKQEDELAKRVTFDEFGGMEDAVFFGDWGATDPSFHPNEAPAIDLTESDAEGPSPPRPARNNAKRVRVDQTQNPRRDEPIEQMTRREDMMNARAEVSHVVNQQTRRDEMKASVNVQQDSQREWMDKQDDAQQQQQQQQQNWRMSEPPPPLGPPPEKPNVDQIDIRVSDFIAAVTNKMKEIANVFKRYQAFSETVHERLELHRRVLAERGEALEGKRRETTEHFSSFLTKGI